MSTIDKVERFDQGAPIRNALRYIAAERELWAGIPMPLSGERLIVEPNYPHAKAFEETPEEAEAENPEGWRLRNSFWSDHRLATILVMENRDGRITFGVNSGIHHLDHDIRTMGCSDAWGIEQEARALATLAQLLPHHAFKRYLLSGMFLETSARSGVTYLFRKLRPTLAISPRPYGLKMRNLGLHILAALCLHPIAYYEGSWAGAMCPTDDVIAHLMLCRGDEHMFWRRANQHCAIRPEAGL